VFFYVATVQRIYLSSDDFYSDSTLILTAIAVKQCMDISARDHICGVLLLFVLTLTDGLCCVWFVYLVFVQMSRDRD
jgi:hypothetical protein